jgi:hypothetical protein
MRTFVESLSLGSGAILVAVVSAGFVSLLCSVGPATLRVLWVAVVPISFANGLYWSPVWLGADPSEYHAWALVVVLPWFLAGAGSISCSCLDFPQARLEVTNTDEVLVVG